MEDRIQTFSPEVDTAIARPQSGAVLRLLVRNHPGVMSHVCGLFARRGFNVDAILCLPIGDATCSVVLLAVDENERLEQLLRQLRKLEDVIEAQHAPEARRAFAAVAEWMR